METRQDHFHDALPGVVVKEFPGFIPGEHSQALLVRVDDGGEIPLHTHEVDARMLIASGTARVLSVDARENGRRVSAGDTVEFERLTAHGFDMCEGGFTFISLNDGIIDAAGGWDIDFAAAS